MIAESQARGWLEAIQCTCLAQVAEHFDAALGDEKRAWRDAITEVLGPVETYERIDAGDAEMFEEVGETDAEKIGRTTAVGAWLTLEAFRSWREEEHQERLFGEAAEGPPPFSHEWTTRDVVLQYASVVGTFAGFWHTVADYVKDVGDGLMDATAALVPADDDEFEDEINELLDGES